MMLETIVEPVFLVFESNQYAGGLSMSRNNYLLGFSQAQEARKVVFDFSQRHLPHRAFRARRANLPLPLS